MSTETPARLMSQRQAAKYGGMGVPELLRRTEAGEFGHYPDGDTSRVRGVYRIRRGRRVPAWTRPLLDQWATGQTGADVKGGAA